MSKLFDIAAGLEVKISKLLSRHAELQTAHKALLQENKKLQLELASQQDKIEELENKYESLRVARAMVGSKEDKHLTKLKINTLIREIDRCIVELSD